jgi:deoxyhypusine synthase
MKEVKDMDFSRDFKDLIRQMNEAGGFSAKHLAEGTMILQDMIKDKECKKFFAFTADIVATGLRGLIAKAIEKGFFDVIVTTCGTLDHDLARAWGGKYYHGSFDLDDKELHKKGMNRLGNIIVPNESYGILIEKKMQPLLKELTKKKEEWSGRELIQEIGKGLTDKNSILYQASLKNIPIYVPGITDGAFGTNLVWFSQDNKFKLNLLQDEKELADIGFKEKNTGALIVGGGISKHHVIWWNQFKGGLDYAIYVTTATEFDGSLSGARTHEAISWGKIKEKARHVNIFGDATIILPIMFSSIEKV